MSVRDIFLCVLIALLWGFNYVTVKVSTEVFDPMTAMFLRYVTVIMLLSPIALKIPRHLYLPIFKVAMVLGVGYFGLFFYAANEVSASLASIILQLQIPFSMMFSALLLREGAPPLAWLGIVLAFIGVFLAIGKISWHGSLFADFLLIVAAACWGYFNIMVRRLKLQVDPLSLNAGIAVFSLPFFLVLMLIMEPGALARMIHADLNGWLCILYMAVMATIFCYSQWFKLIHRYGIALIAPFGMLVTLFAVIISHILLRDAITPHLVLGVLLTLTGISLIVLPKSIRALLKRDRPIN